MRIVVVLVFLSILTFISCNTAKDAENKQIESLFAVEVVDSVIFDTKMMEISDYRNGKYLFFNRVGGDIIVYDSHKNESYMFNHYGKGEEEYSIMSELMYFWNDTTIVVGRIKSAVLYTLTGEFLSNISINRKESYYPVRNIYYMGDSSFIYRETGLGKQWYVNMKNIFVKQNMRNKQGKSFVEFPFEGLEYYTTQEHIPNKSQVIIAAYYKNALYVGNSGRENIKVYDISTLELKDEIIPSYDYFSPMNVKKGEMLDFSQGVKRFYQESVIQKYFINDSMLFTLYSYPSEVNELEEIANLSNNFTENFAALPQRNIALSIRKRDEKMGIDLKLKNIIEGSIVHIASLDKILITAPSSELIESEGKTMFYFARLVEKSVN